MLKKICPVELQFQTNKLSKILSLDETSKLCPDNLNIDHPNTSYNIQNMNSEVEQSQFGPDIVLDNIIIKMVLELIKKYRSNIDKSISELLKTYINKKIVEAHNNGKKNYRVNLAEFCWSDNNFEFVIRSQIYTTHFLLEIEKVYEILPQIIPDIHNHHSKNNLSDYKLSHIFRDIIINRDVVQKMFDNVTNAKIKFFVKDYPENSYLGIQFTL